MLKKLIDSFDTILYVQVWEKRIKVTNISTGTVFNEKPLVAISTDIKGKKIIKALGNESSLLAGEGIKIVNPFSHIRTLISNFNVAERLLRHIFNMLLKGRFIQPSPRCVIHPMEKIEGGLTDVEERAFRELAISAGARDAIVYQGSELVITSFNYEQIKNHQKQTT